MANYENIAFAILYMLYAIPVTANLIYAIFQRDKKRIFFAGELFLGAIIFPVAILASVAFIVFGAWGIMLWAFTEFIPNQFSKKEIAS